MDFISFYGCPIQKHFCKYFINRNFVKYETKKILYRCDLWKKNRTFAQLKTYKKEIKE